MASVGATINVAVKVDPWALKTDILVRVRSDGPPGAAVGASIPVKVAVLDAPPVGAVIPVKVRVRGPLVGDSIPVAVPVREFPGFGFRRGPGPRRRGG